MGWPFSKSANQPASRVICQHFLKQQQPGPSLSQPQILLKAIDSPSIHCPKFTKAVNGHLILFMTFVTCICRLKLARQNRGPSWPWD